MDRLLSFLLFAAFFYLMMCFGCGAHMVHGHQAGHERGGHGNADKDPVCGMPVAEGQGYGENYQGRELHFCSKECLDKFDAQPQRYAA